MTSPQKQKGKQAELEICRELGDQLGISVRRLIGEGRLHDIGDLVGLEDWTAQVAYWPNDTLRAVRDKPRECEQQAIHAGTTFGVSFIRTRGGMWRAVQTVPQWCTVYRELA